MIEDLLKDVQLVLPRISRTPAIKSTPSEAFHHCGPISRDGRSIMTRQATSLQAIPATRVPPKPPAEASAVRLSLASARGHVGPVDGAWWPRSTDAAAELPALIAAVDQRQGEMTLRVGLQVDAWDNIPHRIAAPGRVVRVGWFRSMDGRLVTLSIRGRQEGITLQVIPPQATAVSARSAFAAAVASMSGGSSTGIAAPSITLRDLSPTPRPERDTGQDDWENEGGQFDARQEVSAAAAIR
ncbi:DUF5994 family protein [Nonomuraea sp. NPDC046570]|uniref:DUF5994 family protein n=1 Tax=Nonomuraea sp. NPDC046570 TaxID=3155255 RepID=UPI0033C04C9A